MKKILFLLVIVFVACRIQAQTSQVIVKLKNGVALKGELKELRPDDYVIIKIAGVDSKIEMKKVLTIESQVISQNEKINSAEEKEYPDVYELKIDGQSIKMILVKGGRFRMGYDGNGSRKMHSEPVHDVIVTPFYISALPLPASIAIPIIGPNNVEGIGNQPAQIREYEDVEKVISSIRSKSGGNYRLPTEAEWEYAAISDKQYEVFSIANGNKIAYEWCGDFLDWYPDDYRVLTDPTGPFSGNQHVVRAFNSKRGKYDRSSDIDDDEAFLGLVRLVIKAKDI